MSLSEIKELCKKYNVIPDKSKGQNFLVCADTLKKIVESARLKKTDIVLEVGPGFGILTKELSKNSKRVIAVELDEKIFKIAKKKFKDIKNVEFINKNIVQLNDKQIQELIGTDLNYKIVANLPYNITGKFLKNFLTINNKPKEMILMVQKEVAERICANKGKMSILSVSAQYHSYPEIISIVDKSCFYPIPAVDSAIIRLVTKSAGLDNATLDFEKTFFRIVKIGFSARRKMLKNNLYNGLKSIYKNIIQDDLECVLRKCDLDVKVRAQGLSVEDWKKLVYEILQYKKYE
ncbi:16S rRNA (adenine(1518)-N(6)/adenine(1519)-N(6))-dimethyltransferase RsmA [Patescibacteria group bacterium]